MDWDPDIAGFFHVRIVQRPGMTQWHVWDPGITDGDKCDQQT